MPYTTLSHLLHAKDYLGMESYLIVWFVVSALCEQMSSDFEVAYTSLPSLTSLSFLCACKLNSVYLRITYLMLQTTTSCHAFVQESDKLTMLSYEV